MDLRMRMSVVVLAGLLVGGCQSAYYSTMERLGYEKRDLLVSRVDDARDAQAAAGEQFRSALEQFQAVTGYRGGDLQAVYERLRDEYDESVQRAGTVSERIADVDRVANDLFKEWKKELDLYSNANLRASSERQLRDTRARYATLLQSMRRAEQRMDPVLSVFGDQVLYLKHNLNARAIASLRAELSRVEADVDALVRDLDRAIAEADAFIREMRSTP
jgi:hypothetical protein